MRYNQRATVVRIIEHNTPYGLEEEFLPQTLPCYSQNVSIDEEATIYGGNITESLKLHFQHRVADVEKVFFQSQYYDVVATRYHKRTTVLYLEKSGHSG